MASLLRTAMLLITGVIGAVVWIVSDTWWLGAAASGSGSLLGYWAIGKYERLLAEREVTAASAPDYRLLRH